MLSQSGNTVYSIPQHGYTDNNVISYVSPNTPMVMRHTIYDSLGALVSRPRFDVMTHTSTALSDDVSALPDGLFTSEVYGHRSDGPYTNVSSVTFISYVCGDLDDDGLVSMSDLTVLIDHMFISLDPLEHPIAADLDVCDGIVSMGDLTVLIDHLYNTLAPLECCHSLAKYSRDWTGTTPTVPPARPDRRVR